jgi:hypothetical protein
MVVSNIRHTNAADQLNVFHIPRGLRIHGPHNPQKIPRIAGTFEALYKVVRTVVIPTVSYHVLESKVFAILRHYGLWSSIRFCVEI